MTAKGFTSIFLIATLFSCNTTTEPVEKQAIDSRSYNLGIIGAFGEMVDVGVKKLAFSDALPPAEMDALMEEAEKVAARNHVKLYREKDLIVTLLFPADVAAGKDVLLIYKDSTLDEYMALKKEKSDLEATGKFTDSAKTSVSIQLGKLLSYPQEKIDELINTNKK